MKTVSLWEGEAEDEGRCAARQSRETTAPAVEKLRSSSLSFCITYLQCHVLWERTTVCIRRPQREREGEAERQS